MPVSAAEAGAALADTERTSADSSRRHILKGKTAVIEKEDVTGAKPRSGKLHGGVATHNLQLSIDRHITLVPRLTTGATTDRFLLHVDSKDISNTVYNCFAEMTCLETAEIGSNIDNAVGRWRALLVDDNPAALTFGASAPAVKVKLNGVTYRIDLPTFRGLRRILLATDNEKICAMDIDSYETWLLHINRDKDGTLRSYYWSKLAHVKDNVNTGAGSSPPRWADKPKGTPNRGIGAKERLYNSPDRQEKPRRFSKERGSSRGDSGF
ncbi:MAG TPA: hypothetical protein V6D17_22400 [Candidatus Obscuribacterales bacterium]